MEIKDHLALIRRRLWIIILVPLLAAGATVGLVLQQPQTYSATATVAVPGVIGGQDGQFSGATGHKAFLANLVAGGPPPGVARPAGPPGESPPRPPPSRPA